MASPASHCRWRRRTALKNGTPSSRARRRCPVGPCATKAIWRSLLYTSGSTGQPKDARVLSYLPLAHVFGRAWVECTTLIGGRTQVFFTEPLRWYRRLGLSLSEGYAMTENFGFLHSGTAGEESVGTVGRPFSDLLARIANDGKVLVKSPGQMAGYYKMPELNAESFTEDGYFRTSDLGRYDAKGLSVFTGRKKELSKTANGKYVAPPRSRTGCAQPMTEMTMVAGVGQDAPYVVLVLAETL